MKFKTAQRIIPVLDVIMCVAVIVAVWRHLPALWVAAFILLALRIYLYLRPYACPHCGQAVHPDRGVDTCPKCREKLDM